MRRFLATAVLALSAAACDDHDHEEITANGARVEVLGNGGAVLQALTITAGSAPTTSLSLVRGEATTIRVTWLDKAGASDPVNNDAAFVARITPPSASGITFTLNSGSRSTGTMTGGTVQATPVQVPLSLFHTEENHADLDVNIPVIVVATRT